MQNEETRHGRGEPVSRELRTLTVQIAKDRLRRVPVVVVRARRNRNSVVRSQKSVALKQE